MDISKLSLNTEKVLGSSVSNISHIAEAKGCLVYPAGNIVVFYSPILDQQITYLTHTSDSISCIGVSPDQKLITICDSGKYGTASVYDIDDLDGPKGGIDVKWILRGHKYGIDHIGYSPNEKYIITISNQDGSMFLWEGPQTITKNKNTKNIAKLVFDKKGDLITIGRGYIKIWSFDSGKVIIKEDDDQNIMEGRALSFGKKFSSQDFVDGVLHSKEKVQRLILLSSEGLICIFAPGYEKVEKWVDVMMQGASCLELVDSIALCSGDHALVKAVDIEKLAFKGKFPKPPPTSRQNLSQEEPLQCMENDEFPKCLGAKRVGEFVVTLYSNRSMFIWKMQEDGDVQAVRSILSHRAKVTCLTILEQVEGGQLIFFASASDDHTIRLWHSYTKDPAEIRKSIDVGALLGLKRNVYCKHLTHIIYTHSEHPVTQIKSYKKKSIVCVARNQLLIYSLENFSLSLLQSFDQEKIISMDTWKDLIVLGMEQNKIRIFQLKEEKLEKVREFNMDSSLQIILATNDRLVVTGKGITKCLSLEGNQLLTYYKTEKVGIAGNYLLSCEKRSLNIYSLVKNKRTTSITLNHELDNQESIMIVKSNSWLIVITTNKNRLILLNFSASVLYSEQIHSSITDVELTEQGKIIISTKEGVIIIRNQATSGKYKKIDEKVKKWFEQNDMNWMDGSVWASKNRSHSISGPSQELSKVKSADEVNEKRQKMPEIQIQQSIKLGTGNWADLSVSLKQPDFSNVALQYKNEDNKRSIFNPSSICAQVNKIYKNVDAIQHKRVQPPKPPLSGASKLGSELVGNPSSLMEDKDSSLQHSRPRKHIFNNPKQKQEYHPKFTNNLVESIIDKPQQKISTEIGQNLEASHNQSSIDFGFSQFEEPLNNEDKLLVSDTRHKSLKPNFIRSVEQLMLMPQKAQNHQNLVSIILQHGEQYRLLFEKLDKVFGKEEKESRKQIMLKRMEGIWDEMRKVIDKQ